MKKTYIKKIIALSIVAVFFIQTIYMTYEPGVVSAATAPDSVIVTLTVDSGVSITSPADVTMAPNMGAAVNGSIGSAIWNVKTNRAAGYTLGVMASAAPALVSGGNSFADYQTGAPTAWSLPATSYQFGYSAFGTDVPTATWGTGAGCGSAGAPLGTMKYKGFTTTNSVVATKAAVTTPAGENTTVCFAAAQNGVYAPSGTYTATITATATEL